MLIENSSLSYALTNKDKIIEDAAQYILELTLLLTMDEIFYQNYNECINGYIESVRNYTEKVAPLYYNNNIPMKVLSAISLWDLAHGSTTSSAKLNLMLKDRFLEGGGYAEGTDYLSYLDQELLPYYYIAIYNNWLPENLQLNGVKNSGYWLLNLADKSGVVTPVDDAVNDAKYWLAPYGFINNDNAFKEYPNLSTSASSDPIAFLTYPPQTLPGHWTQNEIVTSEGIGKINITSSNDNADISLGFNTETNGDIKKKGYSHDQQDDGSISIRRVKNGTSTVNDLIIDPGYAGYSNKKDEEYYSNHNTVQINTHPYGGISPCPYGTLQQYMDFYGSVMVVDVSGLSDNLMGGIVLLTSPSTIAAPILLDAYSNIKNMPIDRNASGGPGYSELLKVFSNGFQGKIVFDNLSGTNYALRSVVHIGDEIYVVDQISSNQNDYSVNYNLPNGATKWNGLDNVYTGTSDQSLIRVSVYCSDELNVTTKYKPFKIRDLEDSTRVTSVKFSNKGTNLPAAGQYCSFLSVLEPSDVSVTYGSTYQNVTGDIGNAQILVAKNLTPDIIRYVFVNTITNGTKGTIKIPAITGWHSEFTTDAEFGVIDFDRRTQSYVLSTLNLYSANQASYNGNSVPFNSSTIVPSTMITKGFGNTGSSVSGSYSPSTKKLTLCTNQNQTTINDFTYGYWYYEGDFDFVTKLPQNTNDNITPGFMIRSSLNESDQNYIWAKIMSQSSCGPPSTNCGGINYNSLQVLKGQNISYDSYRRPVDDLDFRCSRNGDKIIFYMGKDNSWNKIDSISFTEKNVYIGYTVSHTWSNDHSLVCKDFDTLGEYNGTGAVFSSSTTDQNKGLTQLGYTTNGGSVTGWGLDQHDNYIYSSGSSESQNVFTFTTPPVQISRNQGSGATFEWKVQFPTWYFNQNFSNNNHLRVDLISAEPDNIYTLDFTPTLANTSCPVSDLQFSKRNNPTALSQIKTGKYTSIGPNSWVKFRVDVLPQSSQNGTGQIKMYYDAGDGLGYVEYMNLVDEEFINFTGIKFTYTTGSGQDKYQVNIGDIRIIQSDFAETPSPDNNILLSVSMKDNGFSENDITKPQLYVKNNGTATISGFKVRLWFSRQEYPVGQITVDNYYMNPSGISLSQGIHPQNANVFYVDLLYPASYSLAAGDSTPVDGVQFGVHFINYYPGEWIKTNDWSWQGMSASFSPTQFVTIYDSNNKLVYGVEPDISQIPQPEVISMGDVFGFENIDAWKTLQGTSNLSSSPKTEGLSSLEIAGGGYQEIVSANLITSPITGTTSHLSFDLDIGPNQPNQYWIGQVQLYANCASAGIYNTYIGQQDLTGKPIGSFSTITMDLASSVLAALNGNFSDFSFKIVLNTNSGSGPYWLDNMRFVNNSPSSNTYEAENAVLSGGANKNTNHAGYSGTGFVDGFYNSTTAQVSFAVNVASAGSYTVKLHYSAGNGTSTSTGLYVNGSKLKNITCNATANWDTWADESETVMLSAGNNTLSYKAETASPNCINLDYTCINNVEDPCNGVQGGENGLRGTTFGLTPSWSAESEYCKATDGDINTFYDYSQANGGYTGLDLGSAKVITKIRYYPRANYTSRMVGGKFQGSNTSSSSGFVDLYTIPSTPAQQWNEVTISNSTSYRWVRYLSPDNGYGNIAEMEFYESSTFPNPNKWYKVATKANPNQCLDVTGGNYANGDTIELWPKINVNQEFKFTDAGNGYYTITCRANMGYSIDMSGNFTNGQKLKLWNTQTYNANQKFKPVALPGGYYRLESSNSGYSIDNSGTISSGVKPWLWASDDNNENQKWIITEVQ